MKIGFNMLLWATHVTEEHFGLIEAIQKVGYDGVEIPLFEGDVAHFEGIGKVLDDHGLARTAVTVIPDEAHSPVSSDPKCREGALEHLKWAIDCCAVLGAETLCGPYHQPLGVFTGSGAREDEKKWAADVHREAAQYAQERNNLTLAIECLNRFECYFLNTMEDAAAHVKRVDHPNFGTMYDSFHSNIEECDPAGSIEKHGDVIRHIHISENDRGIPGQGHIQWDEIFAAIKTIGYDGWLTIEAFGRSLPDLAAATKVWRDFFDRPEDVYIEGYKFVKSMIQAEGQS